MPVSRHSIFSRKSPFGLPDDAFFRQDALSGVPTERFFVRTYFRESRRSIFSPGSTFGNPDRVFFRQEALSGGGDSAFFRQEALSPPGIRHFPVRTHNSRWGFSIFSSRRTIPVGDSAFFRQDVQFPPGIPLFFARKHNSRQVPALFLKKKRKGGLGKSLARLL